MKKTSAKSRSKALFIAGLIQDKKAEEILMLDVRGISNVTDYFIICSGNSTRQNKAIAEHVIEKLKGRKQRIWHVEGLESGEWVLLDGIDVVIHIFTPALRRFYELEKLWAGAPTDRFVG